MNSCRDAWFQDICGGSSLQLFTCRQSASDFQLADLVYAILLIWARLPPIAHTHQRSAVQELLLPCAVSHLPGQIGSQVCCLQQARGHCSSCTGDIPEAVCLSEPTGRSDLIWTKTFGLAR